MIQNTPIKLTPDEFESILAILKSRTGIVPRASHREGIKSYIESRIAARNLTVQGYKNSILSDDVFFTEFVNESTVNETYFFREEKQFMLLRDRIFPMWRSMFGTSRIKIWSAACSYGEEAYSLALLAKYCGLNVSVTASDINSIVLRHCEKASFLPSSVRSVDGVIFQPLLSPYKKDDGTIEFDDEIKGCIRTQKLNLSLIDSPACSTLLPRNQNIIFLRNVFIYFSPELRARILKTLAEKCLAAGGILFVSISEIAQLDSDIIPPSLEKVFDGNVFYFHKKEVI
ncbi:CheR family methyltransferase [uncultured Treponema sp.]|uniref:CheR family methyltransferase n=1 Tax=uncultured Treponema sp. TaxID=162155 RepID=UPI0025D558CA|nr:CheR family methyltransferase [uncultured Treponema sp.]